MVPLAVGKRDKLLQKMRANQSDWRIEELKSIASYFGFSYRQPGTSHVTFSNGSYRLTVPCRKPIKPIYVQKFISMIDKRIVEEINYAEE